MKLIDSLPCQHHPILLLGDFNFPKINWETYTTTTSFESPEYKFIETLRDNFLSQLVREPTRLRGNDEPTTIDLLITNNEEAIRSIHLSSALGASDHRMLQVEFSCSVTHQVNERPCWNFRKGRYDQLRQLLDRPWEEEFRQKDTLEEKWEHLLNKYMDAVERTIPQRKKRSKFKIGLDQKTRKKIKEKEILHKEALRTRNEATMMKYRRVSNQVRMLTRKAEKEKEERMTAAEAKQNPKKFRSFVRSKTKYQSTIPELEMEDGEMTRNDSEKASTLLKYFSSVFTNEPDEPFEELSEVCSDQLDDIEISVQRVKEVIDQTNINKSPGPDSIHPRILKEAGHMLALPLTLIFRESLDTGQLPKDWKTAHLSAIHKKGSKSHPNNYRPVSLTSVACKLLEKIIRSDMIDHLKRRDLHSNRQYGFIEGRSTVLQLLTVLDIWTEALDQGESIDIIYCDFKKAFDKVPHKRLLSKAKAYGFRGKLLGWIANFLTNRHHRVRMNNHLSEWAPVISGIPQGTVLGPMLFVLYVNDLPSISQNSPVFLFADDMKVFHRIRDLNDRRELQEDLTRICAWTDRWLLELHPDKCVTMTVGNNVDHQHAYSTNADYKLKAVSEERHSSYHRSKTYL